VCIFFLDAVGPNRPWMWASGHNGEIRRAAHGYEPTREAALAAFAKRAKPLELLPAALCIGQKEGAAL
jgi:hypothetical protein